MGRLRAQFLKSILTNYTTSSGLLSTMILESFQSKGLTVSHGISEDCTIQMYAVTPYLVALEERVESILKIPGIL